MSLSSATSGFDIELMAADGLIRHLVQLLMDLGDIDPVVRTEDGQDAILGANNLVRRTYAAFPGAGYPIEAPDTFRLTAWDFGDFEPDYAYFSIRFAYFMGASRKDQDFYFKVRKDIDLQAEFRAILEYVDLDVEAGTAVRPYDILRLLKLECILPSIQPFDTEHPENNETNWAWKPLQDMVNGGLLDFVRGMRNGEAEEAVDFLRSQVDPFTIGALDRLAVKCFPTTNRLGLYVNLKLLAHDHGWLGPRGDLDAARDFLDDGDDSDFAAATSPGFASHLVDDALIKSSAAYHMEKEILTGTEALAILDGIHYPLILRVGPLRIQVLDTLVSTAPHTFKDADKRKTEADALRVLAKVTLSAENILDLADENIIAYFTPLEGSTLGIPTADVGIDTDLRIDVFRTLLAKLDPFNRPELESVPLIGFLTLFANALNPYDGLRLSEEGVDLSRLPFRTVRWDPFYETDHGFILEKREFFFEADRLFLSGRLHLTKDFALFTPVWVREAVDIGGNGIRALLYHVDKSDEILAETFFATDRGDSVFVEHDPERSIYRLEYADARARIEAGKLAELIPYAPYSTRQDAHRGHRHIDAIRMLHPEEVDRLESGCLDAWAGNQAGSLLLSLEAAGVGFTEDDRDESQAILEAFVRQSGGYAEQAERGLPANMDPKVPDTAASDQLEQNLLDAWVDAKVQPTLQALEAAGAVFDTPSRRKSERILDGYVRNGTYDTYVETQLPLDLKTAIYAPGTLRLVLTPLQLNELKSAKILDLVGYAKVSRKGHLYWRDIADESTKDNLLSLPEYP